MNRLVLVLAFMALTAGHAYAGYTVTGPAQPVPGVPTNERISYTSPDATNLLTMVGNYPTWTSVSRQLDPITGTYGPAVDVGISGYSACPYLSPDGMTLYYGRDDGGPTTEYRSSWNGSAWDKEERVANLSTHDNNFCVFNGSHLAWGAWGAYGNSPTYTCFIADYDSNTNQFQSSRPIAGISTDQYNKEDPWLSTDNLVLLFSSDMPGGYGGYDLYEATWDQAQQTWTNPWNLGPSVNTAMDELYPRIAEQADRLFFTRRDNSTFTGFYAMEANVSVPEPSTFVMWATGAIGLIAYAWRKRRVP
jgi:hypothetical protein